MYNYSVKRMWGSCACTCLIMLSTIIKSTEGVKFSESQTDRVINTNSACDFGAHDLVKTTSSIRASKVYPSRLHALFIWILNMLAVSLKRLAGSKSIHYYTLEMTSVFNVQIINSLV